MKRLTPLALAIPLLLSGCAGNDDASPSDSPSTSVAGEAPDAPTAKLTDLSEGVEGQIGFRHGLDCEVVDKCSLNFTVESLESLDKCDGYAIQSSDRPAETHLVKATVLVETTDLGTEYPAGEFPVWADWSALAADGSNVPMESSSWCSNDGTQQWREQLHLGDTERRVHYMDVPDGSTKIRLTETLNKARWEFSAPDAESKPSASPSPTVDAAAPAPAATPAAKTPAPTPAPAPSSAAVSAPVVGMTEAPGAAQPSVMNKSIQSCATDPKVYQLGTTFFTDGTSGWTQQCADQMMPAVQSLLQEQANS